MSKDADSPASPLPTTTSTTTTSSSSPTADDLYALAEAAMASGSPDRADAHLAALLAAHPDDPLTTSARLERARLALDRGEPATARAHLAPLLPHHAAAHHQSCRIAVQHDDADADACIDAFLDHHPGSARRREALEWATRRAHHRGGCDAARPWLDQLAATAPTWSATTAWQAACPELTP